MLQVMVADHLFFKVLCCLTISKLEVYLFALFYFHYFLIEKINKRCSSECRKMHFRGSHFKNFWGSMPPEPPKGSGPLGLQSYIYTCMLQVKS